MRALWFKQKEDATRKLVQGILGDILDQRSRLVLEIDGGAESGKNIAGTPSSAAARTSPWKSLPH